MILVKGYCPIHEAIQAQELKKLAEEHSEAEILVHPECRSEVTGMADYVGSTSGIIKYATASAKKEDVYKRQVYFQAL